MHEEWADHVVDVRHCRPVDRGGVRPAIVDAEGADKPSQEPVEERRDDEQSSEQWLNFALWAWIRSAPWRSSRSSAS